MQINSAAIIYGKEVDAKSIQGIDLFNKIKNASGLEPGLGHKWYAEYRTLAVGDARRTQLEKLSKQYYAKLRSLNF